MRAFRAGLVAGCLLVALCPPVDAEPQPSSRDVKKARETVRERSKELRSTRNELATAQARLGRLAADAELLVEAYTGQMLRLRNA
jgi:hypothetical protein